MVSSGQGCEVCFPADYTFSAYFPSFQVRLCMLACSCMCRCPCTCVGQRTLLGIVLQLLSYSLESDTGSGNKVSWEGDILLRPLCFFLPCVYKKCFRHETSARTLICPLIISLFSSCSKPKKTVHCFWAWQQIRGGEKWNGNIPARQYLYLLFFFPKIN